jgi:hypothetical protein
MVEWLSYYVCIRWNGVQSSTSDIDETCNFVTLYKFLPHIGLHHTWEKKKKEEDKGGGCEEPLDNSSKKNGATAFGGEATVACRLRRASQ